MFYDEIVVLHVLYISHDALINVMRFFVVLQVFVICEYRGYVGRTE